MRRLVVVLAMAIGVLALPETAGAANVLLAGNPNFRSVIDRVVPSVPGLSAEIIDFDNDVVVINNTGKTVVIQGYSGDQFARLLPNGTVEENLRSPAYYLNQNRYAQVTIPPNASADAPPQWTVVDRARRFEWHDHRIHLFTTGTPPQVKDKSKTTKIFDWHIPISVGGQTGAIFGTLYWRGVSSGFPIAAIIALVVVVVLGIATVLITRRRRTPGAGPERVPEPAQPSKEAW